MMTVIGLRRVKRMVTKFGLRGDTELNAILQAAVIGLNRLIADRTPVVPEE